MNPFLTTMIAVMATTQVAEARETGSIQGRVQDESELAVPGAVVRLSGAELAGSREATTDAKGRFRIDGIPPGVYDLTVTLNEARIARAEVRVALETTTQARIAAKLGGVSEEIEIVFKPVVDTTASSFSTSVNEEMIQNLPVGRSYQDVVGTIPGVTGRIDTSEGGAGDGNPSVRGEGQYGNNYMLDGVSTRDPASNTFGVNVNFDAIEEIQVYTDGAPAEFGQFTGMFANVVTKDGGDEHHGSLALFYSQHAWINSEYLIFNPDFSPDDPGTEPERLTTKQKFRRPSLAATAGGPLIEEKLWYFVSLDAGHNWTLPEGVDPFSLGTSGEEDVSNAIRVNSGSLLAKATWLPTDNVKLRYQFLGDLQLQANWDAGATISPEATSDRVDLSLAHIITAEVEPTNNQRVELRAGYTNINIDIRPTSGDAEAPSRLDDQGVLHGNALQFDLNDRNRYGGGATWELRLPNVLGAHKIRAGADYWRLVAQREIRNTGETTIPWVDTNGVELVPEDLRLVGTEYASAPGFPCNNDDFSDCGVRTQWTNVGPLGNTDSTTTLFAQDDWQPLPNLTLNLGARLDIEDGRTDTGERPETQLIEDAGRPLRVRARGQLGPIFMPAPRLGLSWDPFDTGKTKVTAHYGQYYDISGNSLFEWGNSRSANSFIANNRDENGVFQFVNLQDATGTPLFYAEGLAPARMDKVNVGFEREVIQDLSIGIRGILSRTTDIPEDVNVNLSDWYIQNSPIKQRNYRAIELTVNKQFDDVWSLWGAYTLQESWGHTPGQFELSSGGSSGSDGNNVGVYLDDTGDRATREFLYAVGATNLLSGLKGLGRYDPTDPEFFDEAGWNGYLPYHSFHSIKLNGSYTAPFGSTFGLVYEFDSGHAWQKRTFVPLYGDFFSFQEGRGTRLMPAVHYVDVRVAHKFGLGKEHQSLEATLDIFNLPGFAQAISYFENDAPGFGSALFRQTPRSIRLGLKYRY